MTRERHTLAAFESDSSWAAAGIPFGRDVAFTESPLCKFEWILLPLAIAELPAGPCKERSLRFVMELEVSERESSMPRGRAGAIAQPKNDQSGSGMHAKRRKCALREFCLKSKFTKNIQLHCDYSGTAILWSFGQKDLAGMTHTQAPPGFDLHH